MLNSENEIQTLQKVINNGMTMCINKSLLRGELREQEPMSRHTSWKTGGNAEYFYIAADINDLSEFMSNLPGGINITWVGLGSNLLVRDSGLSGVVISVVSVLKEIECIDETELKIGAGVTCAKVARFAAKQGLSGIEFLASIPGSIGGALAMNAGAYGGETWRYVKNVETINVEDDITDIFEQIVASPYTRLPMWEENQDNIIGVIHAKDVLRITRKSNGDLDHETLRKIAKSPWFVPETTSLREQLKMFLARKAHFAVVVDEYGALMGVITLEDILEEIVGEITDEHDTDNSDIKVLKSGEILVEGQTPIRDLNRQFNWVLSDDEAITIAGFVIDQAEIIPLPGQTFEVDGFNFEIMKRKRNQITQVKIHPPLDDET